MAISPHLPHRRSRRRTLATLALGATLAVVVAGCSSGGSSTSPTDSETAPTGPVTLTFWSWVPGIEDAVSEWNTANPNIQISLNRIPSSDRTKIPAAVEAGTGPDIAQISQHDLPDYVIKKNVQDISAYVASTEDLYTKASWSAVDFNDKIYGVPQDSGPGALMYRADIFQQYGIDVPKTWDDYVAAAKKLHAADPSVYIAQFSPNEPGFWYQDMVQAGGSWYGTTDNAWTVQVNNAASQKVAARYQELVDGGLVKTEQMWTPEYWADVDAGKIASINWSAWFPALLEDNAKDLAGKWAVAPSPGYGDGVTGDGGGGDLVVLKGAKYPKEASAFITWLNSSPAGLKHLIGAGGVYPAAIAGLSSDVLNTPNPYFGGQNINEVYSQAAKDAATTNVEGPVFSATNTQLTDQLAKVATGDETFSKALDIVAAETTDSLKSAGLSVK